MNGRYAPVFLPENASPEVKTIRGTSKDLSWKSRDVDLDRHICARIIIVRPMNLSRSIEGSRFCNRFAIGDKYNKKSPVTKATGDL